MSDLAKELGAGTLTSEQVDAITHAWLDLSASQEQFEFLSEWDGDPVSYVNNEGLLRHRMDASGELTIACRDSVKELEDAFPFLLEGVEDE